MYVEFLIAFPSLWVFGLCILQLVLLARADLLVRHAAYTAARSAAVVLPDDPSRYGGEPKMSVSREPSQLSLPTNSVGTKQAAASGDLLSRALSAFSRNLRSRRDAIETAARVPLLALGSAPFERLAGTTLSSSLGPKSLAEALTRPLPRMSLDFPGSVDDRIEGPEVTVRVALSFRCGVPVARHIVCAASDDSRASGDTVWRFQHSSTLLVQDAPYEYRRSLEG